MPERLGGLALVVAQRPVGEVERDRVRLAVDVPGEVLGRPAQLEQRLLEVAALGGVHDDGVVVDPGAEHPGDLLGAQHLLEHRPVVADQHQPVDRVLLQPQPAVARHRLGDVDQQRVRDGVAAVLQQRVDDLLGVVAGGARVPEAERRQPVGVDVLGRPLELGERRDRLAAVRGALVVDLEQQGLVGLDDQGSVDVMPAGDGLLAGAVGRDVGPRGAAVGAVAARLVGRGVDVDVGAGGGRADAEPVRAEVADQVGQAEQRLADEQLGDRLGLRRGVDVQVLRVVAGDLRRDRVPDHQLVDAVDDRRRVVGGRGLEDRPQLALELPQQHAVAVGALGHQPLAVGEMRPERVDVGDHRVEEPGRPLGVADEVHPSSLRV